MARILVTQALVPGGLDTLEASGHEIIVRAAASPISRAELFERLGTLDAVVCLLNDSIDDEVFEAAPRLKVVANVAVGVDNIDLDSAARHGVAVVHTPGVLDASTADVAVLLMLAARRQTSQAEDDLRRGAWEGWGLGDHLSLDLSGSVVGLVGYGRIARAVAHRLTGFDVRILHHTRHDTGVDGWMGSLGELARETDVLSLHVPGTSSTHHLVDAEILAELGPTGVVINTARGAVLDEDALCQALESGRLFGAGLDVYDGEPRVSDRLRSAPRVTLLPHIGSATVATRLAMCQLASRGVLDVLASGTAENLVR